MWKNLNFEFKNRFLLQTNLAPPEKPDIKMEHMDLPKNTAEKMLVMCQRFGDFFLFGWSGSILQFRQNIIKVVSKSCSSNTTLSLPSYTGSALKRELNFCNGYL